MKRSTDRILATHAGSLPRPDDLLQMIWARERGKPYDANALRSRLQQAVREVVEKQVDIGFDVVNDGEFGKSSFIHYVNERLGGFEPSKEPAGSPFAGSREFKSFPEYYVSMAKGTPQPSAAAMHMVCTGPATYKGQELLRADIENLKAALKEAKQEEAFMTAIAPSDVEWWQSNEYYKSEEEFLLAVADAMSVEYRAIVEAGFILQIDDPRLVTQYAMQPDWSVEQCRKWANVRVDALNHALRGLPREKVRFHTCYSINMGPRVHDMELKDIVDIFLRVNAGAYSFEASNPRHEHEWSVWKDVKLPPDTVLIPGVVTQSSVLVEHPNLVAERLTRFAGVVGRENVIAGADCGFATFAGSDEIHASIAWAKLSALAEGARIASRQLWGR